MGKIKRFFMTFLFGVIFTLALLYGAYRLYNKYLVQKYESTITMVQSEILRCSELTSIKSNYTDVIAIKKSGVFGLAQSMMLVKYQGSIRAGFESLEEIKFSISSDRNIITLTLPKIVILSNEVANQEVFDEINNVFVPITTQNVFAEIEKAKKTQEKTLIKNGFLKDGEAFAKELFTRLFSAMGFETIIFEEKKANYEVTPEVLKILEKSMPGGTKQNTQSEQAQNVQQSAQN